MYCGSLARCNSHVVVGQSVEDGLFSWEDKYKIVVVFMLVFRFGMCQAHCCNYPL